ncbi:MAG: hypothetical protein KKH41_07635 [Candidatus Thermoplasmatota archaeon]|nr:hypothetical protein [Euryarchaeota archaeon]MBU4032754.1 hypothetical protein [Candidatus Thermoplasmatota archaeon]MBU4070856.1 hypothetical protein [Candidatus Thermoplasmatota archaeon]MBU4143411.1 hypothetical protein [Candidatus Thermoplasmatota archaeon]MBU4592440.1 hypothetical protein [Candidatus Thermoplasmatota archaeon]
MYKVPKDGDVVLAIRNVLARYKVIHSQRELRERVEQELNFGGDDYRVSGSRVRKLTVISGVAKLKVSTKSTGKPARVNGCPVCGHEMKPSRNMTVYGKTITTDYRCSKCEYWTEANDHRLPSRYEFSIRRGR